MHLRLLLLFTCLLNVGLIRGEDFEDNDEEITIEDSSKTSSSPVTTPEKGTVPSIKLSSSNIYFEEQFQDKTKWSRWIKSQAKKEGVEESIAKYDGDWGFDIPHSSVYTDDYGLILKVNVVLHVRSFHYDVENFSLVKSQTSCDFCWFIQTVRFFN